MASWLRHTAGISVLKRPSKRTTGKYIIFLSPFFLFIFTFADAAHCKPTDSPSGWTGQPNRREGRKNNVRAHFLNPLPGRESRWKKVTDIDIYTYVHYDRSVIAGASMKRSNLKALDRSQYILPTNPRTNPSNTPISLNIYKLNPQCKKSIFFTNLSKKMQNEG